MSSFQHSEGLYCLHLQGGAVKEDSLTLTIKAVKSFNEQELLTQQKRACPRKTTSSAALPSELASSHFLTCQTTSATDEVDSVSTTTVCPGCNVITGARFRALRSFFFFRTLVIRAGPRFFFPADHKTEHEGYAEC